MSWKHIKGCILTTNILIDLSIPGKGDKSHPNGVKIYAGKSLLTVGLRDTGFLIVCLYATLRILNFI